MQKYTEPPTMKLDEIAEFNIKYILYCSPPVPDQRRFTSTGLYREGWRGEANHCSPLLQGLGLGEAKETRIGFPLQTSNSKPSQPAQSHRLVFITNITIFIYSCAMPKPL